MRPGKYQICYRGLTLAEAWRFSNGPISFILALILKMKGFKGAIMWLPTSEAEQECARTELSDRARAVLEPIETNLLTRGYCTPLFIRQTKVFDPHNREAYGLVTLHKDGDRIVHVGFGVMVAGEREIQAVSISGGIIDAKKDMTYSFVSHKNYFDAHGYSKRIVVKRAGVGDTDGAMKVFIAAHRDIARRITTIADFRSISACLDAKAWDMRIARGLVLPVEQI